MERLNIDGIKHGAVFPPYNEPVSVLTVQEGPVMLQPFTFRGPNHNDRDLGEKSRLLGRLYIGKDRVYGRFTALRLPNGEVVPVCMEMSPAFPSEVEHAVPLEEGSTPQQPRIVSSVSVQAVYRFE
jgi:serine/threonine-protein kinase